MNTSEVISLQAEDIPIVAIGASAGGLEPYERFFDSTTATSGCAFVIIQHLSPNFHSMMDELLARHSSMKIERVTHGLAIEPNTIYLNPARTEMIVKDGKFELMQYDDAQQLYLPIDTFFKSLAIEKKEKAIAVVLSGTGSDGTKGAKSIKEAGGIVLAQDLSSAKFDGMPGSIIKLGYADAVGYPEMLAENVDRAIRGLSIVADPQLGVIKNPTQRIFSRLLSLFGTEFNYYKSATIDRRLERRANLRNLNMEDYAGIVAEDVVEAEALYADLLIEVTSFFRDPDSFETLRSTIVPELANEMSKSKPVRIWVPGCASGEEAYSLAIMFAEHARDNGLDLHLKILATDIHHRSLDAASTGTYPRSSLGGLSQEQVQRYFDTVGDRFQIKPHLRRMVVFSPHNILKDPPFTKMDLISCRNVLIYFNGKAQSKTLALFHFALRKAGYLFLGPSETTGSLENEFEVVDAKWRLFQKKRNVRLMESVSLLPSSGTEHDGLMPQSIRHSNTLGRTGPVVGPARQAHNDTMQELLRRYAPPGFLLNDTGEIVHVFGEAGEFLQVGSGVFSRRIIDLVDEDLKVIIGSGIERAKTSGKPKFERSVATHNSELGQHTIIVRIEHMTSNEAPEPFMLLTLERIKPETTKTELANIQTLDASEATDILQNRVGDLERELMATEESLQSTIEELETSNEELQATNEELMASNEELQSTNEELHSVNEELYTVSTEHQSKISELMQVTDDMDHLLKATDIGIIFLDREMNIRRFTPSSTQAFNILPQDIGRPISHITYAFENDDFITTLEKVSQTEKPFEQEISINEQAFMLRVLPYRTSLDKVDGVVIIIVNITEVMHVQSEQTTRRYESIVRDLTDFLIRWDPKTGLISYANQRLADELEVPLSELIGSRIGEVMRDDGSPNPFFKMLSDLTNDLDFENELLRLDSTGRNNYASGTVRLISGDAGNPEVMQATGRNVTAQFAYRHALESLFELREAMTSNQEIELLDGLMTIGCEYLGLSRAISGRLKGDNCEITNIHGDAPHEVGELLTKDQIVSPYFERSEGLFYLEKTPKNGDFKDKIKILTEARSLIGTRIETSSGYFGFVIFSDITERSRAFTQEEKMFMRLLEQFIERLIERRQFEEDLEYRRQHYISVYDQAPIMRCTLCKHGKILEANAVWQETLGCSLDVSVGETFSKFVVGEQLKTDWPNFPKLTKKDCGKRTVLVELSGSKQETVLVELTASQLIEPKNQELHYLISMIDVTEKNQIFERIESQKKELEKANEGLSTFAYVASHDLQEPLRKIQQFVDLLEEDCIGELKADGQYYLDVISGSAARISYLVKDILAYTTASSADINVVDVDLNQIMQEVVDDASEAIGDSSAKITFGKLPTVKGDWGGVKLLFQNLVSNGLKYQDGKKIPRVAIKVRNLKKRIVIDFSDNGIGIDEVDGQTVFDPFVRLHSKFEYKGSGIGLAICKTVCDRVGWTIGHKPNPDGGTIFSVTVPKEA